MDHDSSFPQRAEVPSSPDDCLSTEDLVLLCAHEQAASPYAALSATPRAEHARVAALERASVLVVCSDRSAGEELADLLEDEHGLGDISHEADDLRAIERAGCDLPHVVVLDLPHNLRGIEIVPKLRERSPDATLIVVSSAPAVTIAHTARTMGATCYLERSLDRSGSARLARLVTRAAKAAA